MIIINLLLFIYSLTSDRKRKSTKYMYLYTHITYTNIYMYMKPRNYYPFDLTSTGKE